MREGRKKREGRRGEGREGGGRGRGPDHPMPRVTAAPAQARPWKNRRPHALWQLPFPGSRLLGTARPGQPQLAGQTSHPSQELSLGSVLAPARATPAQRPLQDAWPVPTACSHAAGPEPSSGRPPRCPAGPGHSLLPAHPIAAKPGRAESCAGGHLGLL